MRKMTIARCLLILLGYGQYGVAMDIEAIEHVVTSENSEEYSVQVLSDNQTLSCSGASDINISFPEYFEGDVAKSVGVSLWKDGKLLLDVPSVVIELDEYLNISPFHGAAFCLDESLLDDVVVTVAYGRGDVITSILRISNLNGFGHQK